MVEIGETKPRLNPGPITKCKGKLEINTENTVIHEQFPASSTQVKLPVIT